jgi:hypothetical protein
VQSLDVELGQEGKHMRGCLLCILMVVFSVVSVGGLEICILCCYGCGIM